MSQTVARLKELLFDNEAQALVELSRRIDKVAGDDETARAALRADIAAVMERAGNAERFTASVAEIIDEALRRAEVHKHSELSLSIAPLVVTTIKAELKNSQDEMVEALYPITGRLVKAYVASAIKDLAEDMNRRLEQNPVMLRLQSLATGRSVGELALASTQDFEVGELFLIRRGSGELVAHWPQVASGREHLMSGVLAAVNAFANEALAADEASLRQIDLGDETVYLRGSQLYLLAAKCSGTAPEALEQTLDEAFLNTIEKELDGITGTGAQDEARRSTLMHDLGTSITKRIEDRKASSSGASARPLKFLAAAILLPLIGWLGWSYYVDFANTRTRTAAADAVAATAGMKGYPAQMEASRAGRALRIYGLAPSQAVKDGLLRQLTAALPGVAVRDELSVVPGSDITIPDAGPEIDKVRRAVSALENDMLRSAVERSAARAVRRLGQAQGDLDAAAAAATSTDAQKARKLKDAAGNAGVIATALTSLSADYTANAPLQGEAARNAVSAFEDLSKRLGAETARLAALTGAQKQEPARAPSRDAPGAAEALASDAERLAALASVLAAAGSLKPVQVTVPVPVEKPAAPPDPRAELEAFARRNAVFFANGADYRNEEAARRTFDALVPLIRNANVLVRIAGYTDVAGSAPGKASLSQIRADKVREELLARGAPPNLLIAVGRRDAIDLSPSQGAGSPNRRVVFEVGFEDEAGP